MPPQVKLSIRLGISGKKLQKTTEKRSQSFSWNSPRQCGWEPPSPPPSEHFQSSLSLSMAGEASSPKCFRRGSLRAGHGPSIKFSFLSRPETDHTRTRSHSLSWGFCFIFPDFLCIFQKPGDHPNFRKKTLSE